MMEEQVVSVAALYGSHGPPSWSDWNSTSGGQGYLLILAALILVVLGILRASSSSPPGTA